MVNNIIVDLLTIDQMLCVTTVVKQGIYAGIAISCAIKIKINVYKMVRVEIPKAL